MIQAIMLPTKGHKEQEKIIKIEAKWRRKNRESY